MTWNFDNPYTDDLFKIVDDGKRIEEQGTKLKVLLTREEIPQRIKFSHESIFNCIDISSPSTRAIADFLEHDIAHSISKYVVGECDHLDIYIEDIEELCSQ